RVICFIFNKCFWHLNVQGMIGFECTMPSVAFQDLFLNIYMGIFGTGIFVFILSLIFCCCFISKLRHQAQCDSFGYKVVSSGCATLNLFILSIHLLSQQTCAVCLEDFRIRDEIGMLPCQHGFHKRCLVKWLEVRCVCPMCNKPLSARAERVASILDELV
uniref:Ring finger protein 122 n=1 Tax=Astyanax mexicanus TaxID=7994 RepID=A0A3B1IFY9_ASTMX